MDNRKTATECCSNTGGREPLATSLLRKANRMHANAVDLTKLADYVQSLPPEIENILWQHFN